MNARPSLQGRRSRARAEADAAAMGLPRPKVAAAQRRVVRHVEDDEQEALFQWVGLSLQKWPQLHLLHAIPNGGARVQTIGRNGKKFSLEAARMKRQGVKAGVPDLDLPWPVANGSTWAYFGLRIEMKRPIVAGESKPVVSEDQACWLKLLQEAGHCCCVCYGWLQAKAVIEAYLGRKTVPHQWNLGSCER